MKILLTGANGQVAFDLKRQAKNELIALSKDELDITNSTRVQQVISELKPDVVINAAAYTQVDKAEDNEKMAFLVNYEGAKHLAIACEKTNSILIHLSTDYIFDGKKNTPYLETDQPSPLNVYGQSKWAGEEAVRQYCQKHLILRVSGVFGLHGQNFVKTILRLSAEKEYLRIVNDQFTCPTGSSDIAKAIWQLCEKVKTQSSWGTYHYCSSPSVSWYDFAVEMMVQKKNKKIRLEAIPSKDYPMRAIRPPYSVLGCQQIENVFGIKQPDWQIALRDVIDELSIS